MSRQDGFAIYLTRGKGLEVATIVDDTNGVLQTGGGQERRGMSAYTKNDPAACKTVANCFVHVSGRPSLPGLGQIITVNRHHARQAEGNRIRIYGEAGTCKMNHLRSKRGNRSGDTGRDIAKRFFAGWSIKTSNRLVFAQQASIWKPLTICGDQAHQAAFEDEMVRYLLRVGLDASSTGPEITGYPEDSHCLLFALRKKEPPSSAFFTPIPS